uniref:Uncharacterized protein n=1 Tax=Moniliophthora roreri TaxID=221103 RepID=A0A0W0FKY8_MONRR
MIPPSLDETILIDRILANSTNDNLEPDAAVELFLQSGLTPEVLSDVWNLADGGSKGYLSREEVTIALRLMGWAQRGVPMKRYLAENYAPVVTLSRFNPPTAFGNVNPKDYPSLSPNSRAQYQRIFEKAGASEGVLNCERVWQLWIKSELSALTLTSVWDLVDKRREGYLNAAEFCLSMYFIEGLLDERFTTLPPSIPFHVQDQAFEPLPAIEIQSPKSPSFAPRSPIKRRDLEGWNFTPLFLESTKQQFRDLDPIGTGFVNGDSLVPFLLQSTLSHHDLSRIWDLADPSHTGHLSYQGFTIALFLVYRARSGLDIPNVLPLSCSSLLDAVNGENSPEEQVDNETIEKDEITTSPFLSAHEVKTPELHRDVRLSLYDNAQAPKPPTPPSKDFRTPGIPDSPRAPTFPAEIAADESNSEGSSKSPRRAPTTPTLPPKPEEYQPQSPPIHLSSSSSSEPSESENTEALHAEIRRIKNELFAMRRENVRLQSALEAIQDIQTNLEEERKRSACASAKIEHLRSEIEDRDHTIVQLEASCRAKEQVELENASLQTRVQELADKLHTCTAELEVQKMIHRELAEESDSLRRQTEELRESMHIPSSGGDEELQMLINEDLARANTRLRRQVQELTESVAQLQTASVELDAQKQIERSLARENRRLQRRIRDLEGGSVETQTQLRRRVEELTGENQRLRQEADQRSARRVEESSDMPPPAYEEIAVS